MHCPFCRNTDSRVVDSRSSEDGTCIKRRRQCPNCGKRFSTDKVMSGVRKACQGRPVTDDQLAVLAQQVEESIRSKGAAEIDAHDVGIEILGPLRELDHVAYLRFASVYQAFESLEDFETAVSELRQYAASAS